MPFSVFIVSNFKIQYVLFRNNLPEQNLIKINARVLIQFDSIRKVGAIRKCCIFITDRTNDLARYVK